VVEAFAAQQTAVLVLEDLHWADEMSVRLLVVLGRQSRSWPVLLLASMRDVELLDHPVTRRLLAEVDRERVVTPIRLAPLAEADTLSLVRHLAPPGTVRDAVERLGQRVWQLSEGHPFMVVETMRAVQEGAAPESAEELPLAQRIEELILGRLERLAASSSTSSSSAPPESPRNPWQSRSRIWSAGVYCITWASASPSRMIASARWPTASCSRHAGDSSTAPSRGL
jgi:predicted ATPase